MIDFYCGCGKVFGDLRGQEAHVEKCEMKAQFGEIMDIFRRCVHPYSPSVAVMGENYPILLGGADYKRVLELLQVPEKRKHHENCDVNDQVIKGKPCNCVGRGV